MPSDAKGGSGWLNFTNLKIEATIFLLIALTFTAVLGQSAITSQQLVLTPRSGQFVTYTYADKESGGASFITANPARPLDFSCSLGKGFQYPYCGYGMLLDLGGTGKGADFHHFKDVTLRFTYHGPGKHLKLVVKNKTPAALRAKVKDGDVSLAAEFDVVEGENEVHLTMDQLVTEQWWVAAHHLTPEEAVFPLDNVIAIALNSGDQPVPSVFDVSVKSVTFKGAFLTTEQWYLIILGVWLVLTGAFLVFRFLSLRRTYEERQRRQAEEARVLADARAAAEDASAAKSQFLANMSHELRTPLNAILGYAQLLDGTPLDGRQRSAVATIRSSGKHLLTMITDILDIAKVEAGKLELLPEAFDIRACVHTVGQMIRLRAEEKGLEFIVSVADDVPATVVADQKRVRQVLINLLGNAIKFTPSGEVRMEVTAVSVDEGTVRLRFDIVDTGIGIAPEHIGRIFRPFEQSGNSIDRSGGTGLGLSITHKIIEMMDGDITVESEPGKGSRFRVEAAFARAVAEAAAPAPAQDYGRYEVLIVDDREANVDLLRAALETRGFRVRTATNGQEAVACFDTAPSDAVLMDMKMPVLDGSEAIRRIRTRATRHVPVIAITANPSPEAEAKALAAGADRLLAKPVDLDTLYQLMADLLETSAAAGDAAPQPPIVVPQGEIYDRLLALAREGNLRAIRKEIPEILALGPQYTAFATRLDALAAAWQSPAVLRLIEQGAEERSAA